MTLSAPRKLTMTCAVLALAACGGNYDPDLRGFTSLGFDTTGAARGATESRPSPDSRGVISYPSYQVAVAQRGDTVATVAQRVGVNAQELASYNAVSANTPLNRGAVLALPRRVSEATTVTASAPVPVTGSTDERIDVTSIASAAIDRAAPATSSTTTPRSAPAAAPKAAPAVSPGTEPVRHKVARGETAYSIARYYNVPVKSLADWNGLTSDLSVHEGQYLLIPPATGAAAPAATTTTQPGEGSPTPEPPSAAKPLPTTVPPKASAPVDKSAAPDLGSGRSSSRSQMTMPVSGSIIRPYVKKKNDGIDIAAAAGTPVKAAAAGTVAAITKDTEQVPILVLRHSDGLLTVYANIDNITVAKGDSVKRGQSIAKVRSGGEGFVHFEVRQGFDSVDPVPYLE